MSKELAADYFARHTNNECHITSDGRVFHTKGSADSFANGLKDNTVVSFTRDGKTPTADGEDTGEADKVKAIETLKTFEATTAKYPELKALVKALGLEVENQKEATLVAALEAHKEIINAEIQD
jgi:hypothetical protein